MAEQDDDVDAPEDGWGDGDGDGDVDDVGDAEVDGGDGDDGWGEEVKEEGDDGWGDGAEMQMDYVRTVDEPERPATYEIKPLKEEEIKKSMKVKINQLKDSIELPDDECLLLLRRFKWQVAKVVEKYFEDPDKIRKESGVCVNPQKPRLKSGTMECQVCMDDVDVKSVHCMKCGHQTTCKPCWIDILTSAARSKECVHLTCPAYKCDVIVPESIWESFLDDPAHSETLARYKRFCISHFVECSKDYAFCPGKNCTRIFSGSAGVAQQVECDKCSFRFCWACKLETHFPSSCHVGEKWSTKNSAEGENLSWILAKTKKCPKCGVHIEKNQGCNHMTCRKHAGGCGHEFCWLCKGDWTSHGSGTGGYYKCNIYEKNKEQGKLSDEDKKATEAQTELERYEFHWTRYDSHINSCKHALKQKADTPAKMHELATKFGWRLNEAQFIMDAVTEAVECWHVLAWTYPIAYYFEESGSDANKDLFKEQQGLLESFCNGLQAKLDFDLEKLGDIDTRREIIEYTRTSGQYRKNLVQFIETDVSF